MEKSILPFTARIHILFDNKFDLLASCRLGYKIVKASDPNKGVDVNATLTGERYDGEVLICGLDALTSVKPIHDRHTQITQYEVEESRISRMKQVECYSAIFSARVRALQLMQLNTEIIWETCDGQRKFSSKKNRTVAESMMNLNYNYRRKGNAAKNSEARNGEA